MNNSPTTLYLSIWAMTCVTAYVIEYYRHGSKKQRLIPVLVSFLVPALFITFTDTGTDYYSYYRIIEELHTLNDLFDDINTEPLFTLWSTIGWSVFRDTHLVIWSMKIGCLFILSYSLFLLKDKIDIFLAVVSYMSIAYFMSFYLISINMAACFLCLSLAYLINDKNWKGIIMAVVACGFHYSASLAMLPIVAYKFVFWRNESREISKWRFLLVAVISIVVYYSFASILISVVSSYEQLEHYNKYIETISANSSKGSGLLQIVYYLPAFYALYYMFKCKKFPRNLFVLFLFFSAFGLASAELGYLIPILKRSYFIFIPVFCIIVPFFVQSQKYLQLYGYKFFLTWKQIRLLMLLYFVFRLYITFNEHLRPDDTSDLYFYHFFNPFAH